MYVFCEPCLDLALATGGMPAADGLEGFFQPACPLCRAPQGRPRRTPVRVRETTIAPPPPRRRDSRIGGTSIRKVNYWTRAFQLMLSTMIFVHSASRFALLCQSW